MLRTMAALVAVVGLAGCAAIERDLSMGRGVLRVEPHPEHADSVRIVTMVSTSALDPLGRGGPDGPRNVVRATLGDRCADAPIIEEGRVRTAGGRWDATLRVICPAARG